MSLTTMFSGVTPSDGSILFESSIGLTAGVIILSRQGDNGEHLRSTEALRGFNGLTNSPYDADSKAAAIASYRASAASSSDWAEEAIQ